ncbi:MAG: nodulation protein NfeD [Muribaculaceae bacterium]|nr:nodulation protein NfeD [Muribaculaceae bacterium]
MSNRPILSIILLVIAALATQSATVNVYRLNLDDEIGSTTWRYTRQALNEATQRKADMILVHLNTYGGSVLHADSIRTALLNYPRPVVAWIDNNAASAGALIALACDSVYIRSGGSMGAATVVNGTDGTAMPDKYQSYMRAMMRATAEHHGHTPDGKWRRDPIVAEAMVDSRVIVPGLIDSTRVLTFTADEAVKWHFAEATAQSVDEVMTAVGVDNYRIDEYRPTWLDNLIGFFTSPGVQAFLIMIIIGGIYMEFHTPGLGFPAAASIIATILYFLPLTLTGIIAPWLVILFAVGVILIVLEIFVIPGFGVTGITGIIACTASILIALFNSIEFNTYRNGAASPEIISIVGQAIATFTIGVIAAIAIVLYLSSKRGPQWFRKRSELVKTQEINDGYIGVDMSPARHVGTAATTVTPMRPVGKISIDNQIYDAVSETGDFIPANSQVKVTRYSGAQLYIRPIQ